MSDDPQTSSQQSVVITSNTVQAIPEPIHENYLLPNTSTQKQSNNIINQECPTKINLREIKEIPYNEENSYDEEGDFWGETDSENYVPSSDELTSSENSENSTEDEENSQSHLYL